jgi:hypothetical protein
VVAQSEAKEMRLTFYVLFFIFVLALGVAESHGTHVEVDDACLVIKEEAAQDGSFYQWCDLDGDGDAELIQEVIYSTGVLHYLDIFTPHSKRLRGYYEN